MRAIYKCRLCGKEIKYGEASREGAKKLVDSLAMKEPANKYYSWSLYRHKSHFCSDGSIGFADFIGFREEK